MVRVRESVWKRFFSNRPIANAILDAGFFKRRVVDRWSFTVGWMGLGQVGGHLEAKQVWREDEEVAVGSEMSTCVVVNNAGLGRNGVWLGIGRLKASVPDK